MARPVGITLIAFLSFLSALGALIFGGRPCLTIISQNRNGFSQDSGFPELMAEMIIMLVVSVALNVLAGWGLWKLKNWGRMLAIALSVEGAAFQLIRWS